MQKIKLSRFRCTKKYKLCKLAYSPSSVWPGLRGKAEGGGQPSGYKVVCNKFWWAINKISQKP